MGLISCKTVLSNICSIFLSFNAQAAFPPLASDWHDTNQQLNQLIVQVQATFLFTWISQIAPALSENGISVCTHLKIIFVWVRFKMALTCTADSTDTMHSSTVFKSGLVTRLHSVSWLPSNKHIYTQPFRKDSNTNTITSKVPIPWHLEEPLKRVSYATFSGFPPTI